VIILTMQHICTHALTECVVLNNVASGASCPARLDRSWGFWSRERLLKQESCGNIGAFVAARMERVEKVFPTLTNRPTHPASIFLQEKLAKIYPHHTTNAGQPMCCIAVLGIS
jgi:hypothetical protein